MNSLKLRSDSDLNFIIELVVLLDFTEEHSFLSPIDIKLGYKTKAGQ